ncbi:hypothetical protein BDW75DRAFT_183277 [Aspergillus navahoensis]
MPAQYVFLSFFPSPLTFFLHFSFHPHRYPKLNLSRLMTYVIFPLQDGFPVPKRDIEKAIFGFAPNDEPDTNAESSSTSTMPPESTFNFLSLPLEARLCSYDFLLVSRYAAGEIPSNRAQISHGKSP